MAGETIRRLRNLLDEDFTGNCDCRGMKTWYCIEHSSSHCNACVEVHRPHSPAKIRKYGTDHRRRAVAPGDLEPTITCDSIQWYNLGYQAVVRLHKSKAPPRRNRYSSAYSGNCLSCQCPIPSNKSHCSLSCKVDDLASIGLEISLSRTSNSAGEASSSRRR